MPPRETRLETAQRHVAQARAIVEHQRVTIEQRKRRGLDTELSEGLLKTFERTLAAFKDDLIALRDGTRL